MATRYRRLSNRSEGDPETPPAVAEEVVEAPADLPPPNPDEPVIAGVVVADEEETPSAEPVVESTDPEEDPEETAGSSGENVSPAHTASEGLRMSVSEERVRALEVQATRDAEILRQVRVALAAGDITDAETIDPSEGIRRLVERIGDLTPRAKLGDEYRAQAIKGALESGVRMDGNDFDQAGWAETFERMDVVHIQRMGSGWEQIAQAKLPAGRKTADIGTDPKQAARNGHVDAAQFATQR